jgi:DHA1 family tetracycline resistance protein-like MFS transporter
MAALLAVFFIVQLIGQVPAALWIIYGEDRFQWDTTTVGMSLAAFGAVHAIFQAFVTGPLTGRLGERATLLLGMMADATGYVLLALAVQGWMVVPIFFLLAAGGVGMPALQAVLSKGIGSGRQGALQGTLASLTDLTSILGPLGFTALHSATAGVWNGWVWIVGAALYLVCLPLLRRAFAPAA